MKRLLHFSTLSSVSVQAHYISTGHRNFGLLFIMSESPTTGPPQRLRRGLSARQVQMIAIGGTIGTGLFLGTGRSLASGGPASMLICYSIVGLIVYVTLLLLGEMATQYPVAGSFNVYATRFISPSYGFALSWNYWFNDAVSVASDLLAAQLVLEFWWPNSKYVPFSSLAIWVFLVGINAISVGAYGELGTPSLDKVCDFEAKFIPCRVLVIFPQGRHDRIFYHSGPCT